MKQMWSKIVKTAFLAVFGCIKIHFLYFMKYYFFFELFTVVTFTSGKI